LNELELTPGRRDALVRIVSVFRDPRIQALGHKVVKACADGQGEGRRGVTRRLKEIFNKEKLPEMRRLKMDFFHGLHKAPLPDSDVTFDVDSIRFLKELDEPTRRDDA